MRLKNTLAAVALTLSTLTTLSAPVAPVSAAEQDRPEPARVYKDWVVGCHYGCDAVVVLPEGDAEGYVLTLSLWANEYASEDISLSLHDPSGDILQRTNGPFRLLIDGQTLNIFEWSDDAQGWHGSLKRRDAAKLANGKMAEIMDKDGKRVSFISLSGAAAAMRDMDERLGIVGYTHALVAKGKKRGGEEYPPTVYAPPFPLNMPEEVLSTPPLLAEVIDSAIKVSGCADDRDDVDAQFDDIHPLKSYEDEPERALILVGCGHGAYNYNAKAILATKGKKGTWTLELAKILHSDYETTSLMPMLTNAAWDAEEGELTHFNKGRGLGDCGESTEYWWSSPAGAFYIFEIREMPVCRGATYWPAIW